MKIGLTELIVVFVVALVVIGPDKLPQFAKKLGEALGTFRKASAEAASEIKQSAEPLEELKKPLEEAMEPLAETDRSVRENIRDVEKTIRDIGKPAEKEKQSASDAPPRQEADSGAEDTAEEHPDGEVPEENEEAETV